jgi:hypothetical protein
MGREFTYASQSGENSWIVASSSVLMGVSALMSGGLLGFLFGIPRSLSPQRSDGGREHVRRPNTNLEQISDWVTKIFVGVGLTQLKDIPGYLAQLVNYLAPALTGTGSPVTQVTRVFTLGLLVYFSTSGFIIGFTATRFILLEDTSSTRI